MRTLISADDIAVRIEELAAEIRKDLYPAPDDPPPLVVGVLKGSFMFVSDLIRKLPIAHELDFIAISSYGSGTTSSGRVRVIKDLETDISGRDVLLVEDIVDSGRSLSTLREMLELRGPRSIRTVTLLDKPDRRVVRVPVEYVGFTIPDEFVVGYGMDYAERYRELPFVGVLDLAEAAT